MSSPEGQARREPTQGMHCHVHAFLLVVRRPQQLAKKQALAAVGQGHLMRYYEDFLSSLGLVRAWGSARLHCRPQPDGSTSSGGGLLHPWHGRQLGQLRSFCCSYFCLPPSCRKWAERILESTQVAQLPLKVCGFAYNLRSWVGQAVCASCFAL